MAHDSRAVANEMLKIAQNKGIKDMSIMKLIKLVYFAHEWTLGLTGKPLCFDSPEAWQYGPVFVKIYNSVRHDGSEPIAHPIKDRNGNIILDDDYTEEESDIINAVMECLGNLSAYRLSEITHRKGSPWHTTRYEYGAYWPISDTMIREYSKQKFAQLESGEFN